MRRKTVLVPDRGHTGSAFMEAHRKEVSLSAAPWEDTAPAAIVIAPEPPMRRTVKAPDLEPLFDRGRAE